METSEVEAISAEMETSEAVVVIQIISSLEGEVSTEKKGEDSNQEEEWVALKVKMTVMDTSEASILEVGMIITIEEAEEALEAIRE